MLRHPTYAKGKVAFSYFGDIWVANENGSELRRLIDHNARDLYPRFSEQELREAEDNLDRYLAIVLRILERLESDTHPQSAQLISPTSTLGCTPPGSEASS